MNPVAALTAEGQSVWLDFIRRSLLDSGELAELIRQGVRGVTSNPSIFEKAIAGSDDYDEDIEAILAAEPGIGSLALYERLAVEDIQRAADELRALYDETGGGDGYVSFEVSPHLADDTPGTIADAKRLWALVDRPNLMIKVPATSAGVPAIEELTAAGINVNVTLIFSLGHYEAIAKAYIRGLERATDPGQIASVASFFVSRVDTAVDLKLEQIGSPQALALRGTIAVANSRIAYSRYEELFSDDAFGALRARGARAQRLLWGSTGTKNPEYSDVLYIEELIGPDTVNTVPPATLDAFVDHGSVPGPTLKGAAEAATAIAALASLDVDLDLITAQLQVDGVRSFADAFDGLIAALDTKVAAE